MKLKIFFLFLFFFSCSAWAEYLSWEDLQFRFNKISKNPKALGHVSCFFKNHENEKFQLTKPISSQYFNRCYSNSIIEFNSNRYFAIIDYTVNSDQQRMFIIDRITGNILKMAVAHGRYKAGFFNHKIYSNHNSIKEIKYYSNKLGSMASSSGFFLAGQDFIASDFGRSLVIHGLEPGINDNACLRNVVIHQHFLVSNTKAYMLSSGCPMISPDYINKVIHLLKGKTDDNMQLKMSGALIFIFSEREAAWPVASCP